MLVQGQEVSGLRDQPLERIGNMIDRRLLGRKFGQRRGLPGGRRRVGEAHCEVDHLRHRNSRTARWASAESGSGKSVCFRQTTPANPPCVLQVESVHVIERIRVEIVADRRCRRRRPLPGRCAEGTRRQLRSQSQSVGPNRRRIPRRCGPNATDRRLPKRPEPRRAGGTPPQMTHSPGPAEICQTDRPDTVTDRPRCAPVRRCSEPEGPTFGHRRRTRSL